MATPGGICFELISSEKIAILCVTITFGSFGSGFRQQRLGGTECNGHSPAIFCPCRDSQPACHWVSEPPSWHRDHSRRIRGQLAWRTQRFDSLGQRTLKADEATGHGTFGGDRTRNTTAASDRHRVPRRAEGVVDETVSPMSMSWRRRRCRHIRWRSMMPTMAEEKLRQVGSAPTSQDAGYEFGLQRVRQLASFMRRTIA